MTSARCPNRMGGASRVWAAVGLWSVLGLALGTGDLKADVDFLRGDANADGRLSISDSVMMLLNNFVSLRDSCREALDANADGFTSGVGDPIYLFVHLYFAVEPPIAAPYPEVGPGTEEALSCETYDIVPPELTDDEIRLGEVQAEPGDEVWIPVYLTNAEEVHGFQLLVEYDPEAFIPRSYPGDLSLTKLLAHQDAFHGSLAQEDDGILAIASRKLQEGVLVFAVLPDIPLFALDPAVPPGEDRLVFNIPGRIPDDAPEGSAIELRLSNGPNSQGWGPDRLVNELTYIGESRFISTRPQRLVNGKISIEVVIFIRGDATRDGVLGIEDALAVLQYLFLGTTKLNCFDAADANDDGEIDIADAMTILLAKFVGSTGIPAPYPASGKDPSSDSLADCKP